MGKFAIALIVALAPSSSVLAQGHAGTPEEQQACSRDASRFCRRVLGDDSAVRQCLEQHRHRLSSACRKVFESHGM
ncbi:cysteine rich repeat-containing protein [Bradyrhizobium sp. STM 3562]|uniref:cysteine rich repeat-containing protein n=1 Tax=Bradyrhizobium sp. STM 3562 TaxID=578924 RepID=UPI00388E9A4C